MARRRQYILVALGMAGTITASILGGVLTSNDVTIPTSVVGVPGVLNITLAPKPTLPYFVTSTPGPTRTAIAKGPDAATVTPLVVATLVGGATPTKLPDGPALTLAAPPTIQATGKPPDLPTVDPVSAATPTPRPTITPGPTPTPDNPPTPTRQATPTPETLPTISPLVTNTPGPIYAAIPKFSTWVYTDATMLAGASLDPWGPFPIKVGWGYVTSTVTSWLTGGPAPYGYDTLGVDFIGKVITYGPNIGAKLITSYYRKTFFEQRGVTSATINIRADDGAIVYLNGQEIHRQNMTLYTVPTSVTVALSELTGNAEPTYYMRVLTATHLALFNGLTNVLGVELHQRVATTNDASFDLELVLVTP